MKPYNSKLGKYHVLRLNKELAPLLPHTEAANAASVRAMLNRYGAVYLKPNNGTGGYGIFKMSRTKSGVLLQSGLRSMHFANWQQAYRAFVKNAAKRMYLVQMGIPLMHFRGRPFDLRVMVQRNPMRKWEVTGIVGRLAQPKKIVTNYHNGGRPLPADILLAPSLKGPVRVRYNGMLKRLGVKISAQMGRWYPRGQAFGIDIGIDSKLKPWIIEVNTRPDKTIFRALADKSMYHKIMRYARIKR